MENQRLWLYRARCIRVVDGDTVVALVDAGFGIRYEATLRIAGIDAPELPTPEGVAAADRLGQIVRLAAAEWPVVVETVMLSSGRDARSFTRYVARVWALLPDGRLHDVGDLLVQDGFARPYPPVRG